MTTIRCNDNWVHFNSHETQYFLQNDNQDQEEETLSLCDLPINNHETEPISKTHENEAEDFEFGSCHAQKNMCNADEVFFQGQMLPLRHSVSYESSGLLNRKINRCTSMSDPRTIRYKPKIRNQFHSHPSPSPQIKTQSFRGLSHANPKTSSLWSFLQVSLVKPQEIGLSDLKNRSKRFGSHNSNSSSTSSSMNSTIDQNQNENKTKKKKKKKQKMFLVSGCKCSADSIERTIKETVPKRKTTKEESMLHLSKESTMMMIGGGEGKQTVSRHRTFEWLKQLSIVAAQSEVN